MKQAECQQTLVLSGMPCYTPVFDSCEIESSRNSPFYAEFRLLALPENVVWKFLPGYFLELFVEIFWEIVLMVKLRQRIQCI